MAGHALVDVVPMAAAHIRIVADLHAAHLDGFFSQLGPGFLRSYYESFRRSPHAVTLVALDGTAPVGMVVGAIDERAHFAWVARHRTIALGLFGALAMFRRPAVAAHFARTRGRRYLRGLLRFARGRSVETVDRAEGVAGVLSHIAVASKMRGKDVGTALEAAFVDSAGRGGSTSIRALTRADDRGAAGFYTALGWRHMGRRTDVDGVVLDSFEIGL